MFLFVCFNQNVFLGVGEVDQQLRALAVLAENLSLVHYTQKAARNCHNSHSRGSDDWFWALQTPGM